MTEQIPSSATRPTELEARLRRRLDQLTKPPGSLGRLEEIAVRVGLIQGTDAPQLIDPQVLIFAGDHGLTAQGVSAFPADVTAQMVLNFLAGGAAISVLARRSGLALTVVDAGVRSMLLPTEGLVIHKIAAGTADASLEPAMTEAQRDEAIARGGDVVAASSGNVVLLGEMGIGNTSSAALLLSRLTGAEIDSCTGRGTGLDDAGLSKKRAVLRRVLQRHPEASAPLEALAAFGGFEIAMMVGAALQAAKERRVILVDGFVVGAAILVAARLEPSVLDCCIHAHRSAELGHGLLLEALGAHPLLDLGLRLGEGSGAAVAWPIVDAAVRLLSEMASFGSAGVTTGLDR